MTDRKLHDYRQSFARRLAIVSAAALLMGFLGSMGGTHAQTPAQPAPGATAAAGRAGSPGRTVGWEWWNDADVQRTLALAPEKVRRIHEIFTRRSEELGPMGDEFMRAFAELEKLTRARVVDEATYQLQVVRVEALRAELNKSRTVMLYRLTRELSPDQFKKLEALREQRFAARGRGGQGR